MKSSARLIAIPLMLLLAVLLQACGGGSTQVAVPDQPDHLKVLLLDFISFAPYFIADREGYWAEQGLEIEYVEIRVFEEAFPLLASGDLDVAAGTLRTGIFNAISRGGNIRVVADKGHVGAEEDCSYITFLARPDLVASGEMDEAAEIAGHLSVVEREGTSGYFLEKLISPYGLTLDDVPYEIIPPPTRGEAMQNGAVDMVYTAEPYVTLILEAGQGVIWFTPEAISPGFQSGVLLFGPTLLEDKPEVGKRFMLAYLKGVRDYLQGKTDENVALLAEATGTDEDLVREMCWPVFSPDGDITVESLTDFQEWAFGHGYLDEVLPEERWWDPAFIDYANAILGQE